ncbi:MAG TPA: hypothetical protein PKA13_23545 [Geminicoccaceae bacterium]|nr:hypothetical protein [Geminicoccus sp.]HMU52772.1 hypothetical protein [Geminicoccaceae bacterium]
MSTLLPIDDNGNPISILGFDYRGTRKLAVGSVSVRNATPIADDIEVVSLIATGFCRFEIGDATVTADASTSPFLYPGQYVDIPLRRGERYVAFIAEGADCDAYVVGRL